MEPKFKEIVRRDPNVDLTNKSINEWPIADKIQGIAGGPIVAASKAGVFDKVWEALKNFYNAWKNYNGKIRPMVPKAGFSIKEEVYFKDGGRVR